MKPVLIAVSLKEIDYDTSIVHIKYRSDNSFDGIELHGVDAGLSWLKGESLELQLHDTSTKPLIYEIDLTIKTTCEFRARGYVGEEEHWEEGKNHRINRLPDGTIELLTSYAILDYIEYTPSLPQRFSPSLKSVILESKSDTQSQVTIRYQGSKEFEGIELHGVDAGLSWLRGESIMMKAEQTDEEDLIIMKCELSVVDSCEFKARGYIEDEDYWEDGKNHKIIRMLDGLIDLEVEDEILETIDFKSYPTIDFSPSIEVATERLVTPSLTKTRIFQYLVDISIWVNSYLEKPLDDEKISFLTVMIRYVKLLSRQFKSHELDTIIRPVNQALYDMYVSARQYSDENFQLLVDEWEKKGYRKVFTELPDKVQQVENYPLGVGEDAEKRIRELAVLN
jgi:hypothetical protein